MRPQQPTTDTLERRAFYAKINQQNLIFGSRSPTSLRRNPAAPASRHPGASMGDLITAREAERRVLVLARGRQITSTMRLNLLSRSKSGEPTFQSSEHSSATTLGST